MNKLLLIIKREYISRVTSKSFILTTLLTPLAIVLFTAVVTLIFSYETDEIQNIAGWEKFVRRLFESGKKIFVTGSNAKLLSSELATTLSGRNLKFELYPFSFREFLEFHKFSIKKNQTTEEKSLLKRKLERLNIGLLALVASKFLPCRNDVF